MAGDVLSNMHIRREYIHGPGIDNSVAMITFYDDELVGLYFYHTDALGSVIAMTSVNGVVEEKYRYSPFGRTTIYDRSGSEIARSAIGNPYMFTARRLDEESGLYYYRARMNKPEIGRFLQTDPLGYIDTINPYAYCANNPLNRIDPWGLNWLKFHDNQNLKSWDNFFDAMGQAFQHNWGGGGKEFVELGASMGVPAAIGFGAGGPMGAVLGAASGAVANALYDVFTDADYLDPKVCYF